MEDLVRDRRGIRVASDGGMRDVYDNVSTSSGTFPRFAGRPTKSETV